MLLKLFLSALVIRFLFALFSVPAKTFWKRFQLASRLAFGPSGYACACAAPFDAFRLATEHLTDTMYRKASYRSVWLNLIPKEVFPKGIGLIQSIFTIGRSEPATDEPAFVPITVSTGGVFTGTCGDTYDNVPVGFQETTFSPEQFALRGPTICQDDLIYNHQAAQFLTAYIPAITKYSERQISNRLQAIYSFYCQKFVANTNAYTVAGSTGSPPQNVPLFLDESHCELDQLMLDQVAQQLMQAGATDPNSDGWIQLGEDGPIFPIYIGMAQSQRLTLDNADIRSDSRYAYMQAGEMAPTLLRLGATKVIRNFRHVINLFPPRYTYAGGQYTRVPTWIQQPSTKGDVAQINPVWQSQATAPFEGAWVLSPWVFHDQAITPTSSAAGLNWQPKSYMGEWLFQTGGYKIFDPPCFDPGEKLGAHFGWYKHAAKPIFPEYGYLIIFKRCDQTTYPCATCTSPTS